MNFSILRFTLRSLVASYTMFALILVAPIAFAGDGHDHGETKKSATGPALPRFTAQSELFDAVGVLSKGELAVWIDRAASNEPVLSATVELESAGVRQIGKFEPALGEYHFDGKPFATAGEYPITLTIKAGADTDLLTGDLDVHDGTKTTAGDAYQTPRWQMISLWAAVALAVALLIGLFVRRATRSRRSVHMNSGSTA